MNCLTDWLFKSTDNLATLIGYVIVAIGARFTYRQWTRSEAWKRREVFFERVSSFIETPGNWNAILLLEYFEREVALWDKNNAEERYEYVTREQVATALIPPNLLVWTSAPKEMAIRDSFDDLLGRFAFVQLFSQKPKLLKDDEIKLLVNAFTTSIKRLIISSNAIDKALIGHLFLYINYKNFEKLKDLLRICDIDIDQYLAINRSQLVNDIADNKWQRLPDSEKKTYQRR